MSAPIPAAIELLAAALFGVALVHTFSTRLFHRLAHSRPRHAGVFHLLAEVEVAFGWWAMALVLVMIAVLGREATLGYLDSREFTEPLFVFAVMVIAGTRPVIALAAALTRSVARRLPLPRGMSFYFTTLSLVPLLGSFITEPAAMTLAALLLRERYYRRGISNRLKYVTLGVLFVNVSIGGTLTPYAAPPVLMVASTWGWDLGFMVANFGWKVALAVAVNAFAATMLFRDELRAIAADASAGPPRPPFAVIAAHVLFLAGVVAFSHHPVAFMGILLFFLGFATAYPQHQDRLILREGLLVAFFLAGLVVLGGLQRWWLEPMLQGMDARTVYFGAALLTAITDNAALTYLGSLVNGLDEGFKYAMVAGAVTGGGLTVIANAPNPAGFAILREGFPDEAIRPLGLLAAAVPPTLVAMLAFHLTAIGGTAMQTFRELHAWIVALEPAAAFLMLLPFVVAAAGLLQYWLENRKEKPAALRARAALRRG